jgi:site-specific recombinase XerD
MVRDWPLFSSRKGNRLSLRQVRGMFRRWQEKAGIDHFYRFHELRHTAITNVRRKTKDIRIAQLFARHANIETTLRYEHASDEELVHAVKDMRA